MVKGYDRICTERGVCMFELAKRYSEDRYYRKEDILEEMDAYLIEPVWEEICKYRSIFKIDYAILGHRYYLIYNPRMIKTLMKTQQLMLKGMTHNERLSEQKDIPDSLQPLFVALSGRLYTAKDESSWFRYSISLLSIQVEESFVSFLCNDEEVMLVKLFYLLACYKKEKKQELLVLFLMKEGYLHFLELFRDDSVSVEEDIYDMTPCFLAFLHNIWLKISNLMVLLKGNCDEDTKQMQFEELKEKYPCCSDEQLHFYIDHRLPKRYYTIRQYMEYTHVCYETARYSMEQFVQQNWYQKQKLGKKFVYKVL